MANLDRSAGSGVKRKIAVVNITGQSATQIENTFNNTYGNKGWIIVQAITIGVNTFVIAEKEY